LNKYVLGTFAVAIFTSVLTACGGGGDTSPQTAKQSPPIVNITLSKTKANVGTSVTLTWSSSGAISCVGSESMTAGTQLLSGSTTITPNVGGQFNYTISCAGAGGTANNSVLLRVPMPVFKSSYENKMAAGKILGPQKYTGANATAYADFLQDGSYSMVTMTLEYDAAKSISQASTGHIHFFQNTNGTWTDITSKLITDTTGCIHPRKAMVADINGDGKPDVVFACHGYDAPPYSGEKQRVLLSQTDGTYKNALLPITAYAHGGSVADFDGNGYADIIYTDTSIRMEPFYLLNNKDGTFTEDSVCIPKSLQKFTCFTNSKCGRPIYSMEFIDFNNDGKYDIWVGGSIHAADANGFFNNISSEIFYNPGNSVFSTVNPIVLPTSLVTGVALDVLIEAGKIAILNTLDYAGASIDIIDIIANTLTTPYTHSGVYSNGSSWFDWIIFFNGNIVPANSEYKVTVPIR